MYAQDSIDLLTNAGIQFNKHDEGGIEVCDFAELLMTSGIVLTDNIKWLSFHRYIYNQLFSQVIYLHFCTFVNYYII